MVAAATRTGLSRLIQPGAKEPSLEGAHRCLLDRFGMIPTADVERAMRDEQAQLVRRRPADVAGLTATTGLRLLHGSLHRHDDVAQVETSAWWQH